MDAKVVLDSLAEQKLDLTDQAQWNPDTFYKTGQSIGADLVVFVVITESRQRMKRSLLIKLRQGSARIELWLLDVKNHVAIKSSNKYYAKRVSSSFVGDKGSALQVDAVRHAIQNGLSDFLKPYVVVKAATREDKASPRADGTWIETPPDN